MNPCDTCIHQGPVPNSRHSSCKSSQAEGLISRSEELKAFLADLTARNKFNNAYIYPMEIVIDPEHIETYDPIGNGWFIWPFNFDPNWIKSCTGQEEGF